MVGGCSAKSRRNAFRRVLVALSAIEVQPRLPTAPHLVLMSTLLATGYAQGILVGSID